MTAVGGACSVLLLLVLGAYGGPECVHTLPDGSCMLGQGGRSFKVKLCTLLDSIVPYVYVSVCVEGVEHKSMYVWVVGGGEWGRESRVKGKGDRMNKSRQPFHIRVPGQNSVAELLIRQCFQCS